jgi:hypothetical protein
LVLFCRYSSQIFSYSDLAFLGRPERIDFMAFFSSASFWLADTSPGM